MKITDEIHIVDGAEHCRLYLLVGQDGLTLIDAGDPGDGPKVLDYLEKWAWKPQDIKRIVLTHKHGDHVGDLKMLADVTGAKVLAHEADADAIDEIAKVDRRLKEGDAIRGVLGELKIVHVPGHTEGCIVPYSPSRKVIFTGDVVINHGELTGPIPEYCADLAQAHQSLRQKIAPLDFEICCFAHGDVITEGAGDKVRAVIAGLTP